MEIINNIIYGDKALKLDSLSFLISVISMIIIPLYFWFMPPIMVLWGIICLLGIRNKIKDFSNIDYKHKLLFFLFISFYIWQLIGLLYSENFAGGIRNIVLRLSILLFPLVLICPGKIIQGKDRFLLKVFAVSTFIYILICYAYAFFRSIDYINGAIVFNPHPPVYDWLNYFFASDFAIFQHPSYLSMFIIFSVYIALQEVFAKTVSMTSRVLWLMICVVFLSAIYLLSSRAGMLATIISIPIYLLIKLRNQKIKKYLAVGISITFIAILAILISNPRLINYFKSDSKTELLNKTLKESRLYIWKASFNIIKNNLVFGVGTGGIQNELNMEYTRLGNTDLIEAGNLNSHNQYLEVIAEHGLIGLILLLSVFVLMLLIAISERNILLLMFIIIVTFSLIFETMFNRLAGVSFFSLFSFLLLNYKVKKE